MILGTPPHKHHSKMIQCVEVSSGMSMIQQYRASKMEIHRFVSATICAIVHNINILATTTLIVTIVQ